MSSVMHDWNSVGADCRRPIGAEQSQAERNRQWQSQWMRRFWPRNAPGRSLHKSVDETLLPPSVDRPLLWWQRGSLKVPQRPIACFYCLVKIDGLFVFELPKRQLDIVDKWNWLIDWLVDWISNPLKRWKFGTCWILIDITLRIRGHGNLVEKRLMLDLSNIKFDRSNI